MLEIVRLPGFLDERAALLPQRGNPEEGKRRGSVGTDRWVDGDLARLGGLVASLEGMPSGAWSIAI